MKEPFMILKKNYFKKVMISINNKKQLEKEP